MSPEQTKRSVSRKAARPARPWRANLWNKAGYAALFLVLALTAVQCFRLGMAGLYVQTAQAEVERWGLESRAPRRYEIRNATDSYLTSLEYASANPWALEGLGAVELARMHASTDAREALAVTRSARVRFREALLLRPTSPFLWANLALTKLYLDEIDDELLTALRHADELGPWEPTVQETVLFVGLAVWNHLDPNMRRALTQTLERGALRNAPKMLEIVKSYRRYDLVCAIDKYRVMAGPACATAAQAPRQPNR